jgi:HD-GYP domain-containing protein (c-di-GMP phosphodiesterase class II)
LIFWFLMRLIRLDHITPGDRLGRDVTFDPSRAPLLRAGVVLLPSLVASLRRHDVETVWIDDDLSRGIDPAPTLSDETRQEAARAIKETFDRTAQTLSTSSVPDSSIGRMKDLAELIAAEICESPEAALALADLASADTYTMQHSLGVTTLGLLIGHRVLNKYGVRDSRGEYVFDDIDRHLVKLGTGLLLHDIGKLAVPFDVLHKPGKLTDEEYALVKQHPETGFHMLKDCASLSSLSTAVVRYHHERWDGTGYPTRKAGDDIPMFARIAAVADVYDAITSNRPYCTAMPADAAYREILEGAGGQFDAKVVEMFKHVVAPYPEGQTVELSNGLKGIVSGLPKSHLDRPVVRLVETHDGSPVSATELELLRHPELTVTQAGVRLTREPEAEAA